MHEGNYPAARENSAKSLAIEQAIGDRAGEADTWHNLATIDLNEGNYPAAREKFGKALTMRQAIGDRNGEAATLHQIGFVAWERDRKDTGIRLVAICVGILSDIGSGDAKRALPTMSGMAHELGLDQAGFDAVRREAAEAYQRDRGAELVRRAFEGL